MPAVAPMPSASETMATAVTKGVLTSVRKANVRQRIKALDELTYCGVYRLGRNALGHWRGLGLSRGTEATIVQASGFPRGGPSRNAHGVCGPAPRRAPESSATR